MNDGAQSGLRLRSPVHGLARRRLGPLEVLAQSVSGAAPSAAMAAVPAIVAASAGGGTVWSFVIATVLALLIAACIARFTRRMAAPGGLYSLTAKGLTPAAAYASAVGMVVGYGLLAAGTLAGFTIYAGALLGGTGITGPVFDVLTVVAAGAVSGLLVLRGARLSARVVLLVESVSIVLMLVVFTLLLATSPSSAAPAAPAGAAGVAAGVLPALTAFIGFEIATALGAEARRPFRSVPRAVGVTAAVAGVLYVFAAHVQVVGFSTTPGGLAGEAEPVVALAVRGGWPWIPAVLDAGLAASFLAGCLAASTALVRVLFSLARDDVVPAVLGRTHPAHRTPHVAVAVAFPVVTAVPAVLLAAGVRPATVLMALVTLAACGFLLAYVLVCAAAPVFLRRIGELTWPAVAVSVVLVPILVAVLVVFVADSPWSVPVLATLLVAGTAGYVVLRVRRPGALAAIGVYDETTADDVLPERAPVTGSLPLSGRQPRAVRSALEVLEQVVVTGPGVTAKEISEGVGLPQATTYRILNLLVAEEYLVRLPDLSGFALGRRASRLALPVPATPSTAARAVVAHMRTQTRWAVHLAWLSSGRITMADADPDHPGPDTDLLARHPYAFALGRLLLAAHADWRVLVRDLRALTPRTVVSEPELDRALAAVTRDGIARQCGEAREDRGCIALPVRAPDDGRLVAGLALAGPTARVAEPNTELVAVAREHADRLAPLLA